MRLYPNRPRCLCVNLTLLALDLHTILVGTVSTDNSAALHPQCTCTCGQSTQHAVQQTHMLAASIPGQRVEDEAEVRRSMFATCIAATNSTQTPVCCVAEEQCCMPAQRQVRSSV